MLGWLARGTFLVLVGVMFLAWAVSMAKSSAPEPQIEVPTDRMYS
jgi:hypothetical protein